MVEHVLVWERLAAYGELLAGRDHAWSEIVDLGGPAVDAAPLDAEHPLFIAYTSGTTGRPKGAVHVHGGFLVKIAEEVAYQADLHPGELVHWSTDLGWIMGPWEIVGALALGATVMLTEGAPTHPGPDRLWETGGAARGHDARGLADARARVDRGRLRPDTPRQLVADLGVDRRAMDPDAYHWLHPRSATSGSRS